MDPRSYSALCFSLSGLCEVNQKLEIKCKYVNVMNAIQYNSIVFNLKAIDNVCEPMHLHRNVWALLVQLPQQSQFLTRLCYHITQSTLICIKVPLTLKKLGEVWHLFFLKLFLLRNYTPHFKPFSPQQLQHKIKIE